MMTAALVIAGMLILREALTFGNTPRCVMCSGKGAHRDDCPMNRR